MKHARSDYAGVQDASGKIPDDEPVFVLRARDALAPLAVRHWADLAAANGVALAMVEKARTQALRMAEYRRDETHLPDMPEDA